jgi:DUF1680 family protein
MKTTIAAFTSLASVLIATSTMAQDRVDVLDRPDTTKSNSHYAGHREPLLPSPLIHLPFGAIKPQGWLRKQLELQGQGFVGHLTEISSYCNPKGNAWLDPQGKGANGWEEAPYWLRGFAAMAFVLDDKNLIAQAMPWIENAFASQRPDGYFGPVSNLSPQGSHDLMSNQNMLFVLRAYYEYSGDKRVLELMKKYFAWEMEIPDNKFFSSGWQVPRNADDMESAYWLYNRTGDPKLLEFTAKLQRCGSTWMKVFKSGHNVDFSQGFRKPALFYPQNKDPKFLEMTESHWDSVIDIYGQVPGGAFGGDEFARPGYTDPRQAIETCGAAEMIISHPIIARITGDPKWADRCENIAFNTLPATMTADMKALRYLTSANQVNSDARSKAPELADAGPMQVMDPHDHRCCQHNAGAGWPYYAQALWMATSDNGLAAFMYSPSSVTAKVASGVNVTISEETNYPFDGTVTMKVNPEKAVNFPLHLRVPAWCTGGAKLAINGKPVTVQSRPGSYIRVDRNWKAGDTIVVNFPRQISITTWAKNQNSVSVNYGPLTFSVKIGENYVRHQPERRKEPWPAWEILPSTPWNYALQFDAANLAASFEVVSKPWPASNMPFTHEGTPIEIKAKARKLPNWKEDHIGLVDKLQPSPVKTSEPLETITMIPMGAARLRLAALPVVGTGPDAREWKLPAEPLVSFSRGAGLDPYEAMFDGKIGQSSHDTKVPRFSTFSFGGSEHGKMHWVRRNFDAPLKVSECSVYWFDESPLKSGDIRLPKSWRLMYLSGKEWKEVEKPSGYGIEPDTFNKVTFQPVTTTAMRLEVQTQDGKIRYAMGIYEWSIPGVPLMEIPKK